MDDRPTFQSITQPSHTISLSQTNPTPHLPSLAPSPSNNRRRRCRVSRQKTAATAVVSTTDVKDDGDDDFPATTAASVSCYSVSVQSWLFRVLFSSDASFKF
ncbi:hypothetical protein HanRHA438_Chr02g0060291 [Helianthus annuus]|nr:hypothetical protein HanRHA438_Chr02g0060291 [Helianthus annuus]